MGFGASSSAPASCRTATLCFFSNPKRGECRIGECVSELSDDEVDRLLSRGMLGQEHKQRVLQSVLASVQATEPPRRRAWWRWPAVSVVALSGALAVAALWVQPSTNSGSALREKGAASGAPIIAMSCLGGALGACPTGSRIAFWLEGGSREPGFVTAYAESVTGGERVWLLTNETVPRAALIGKGQPSGRYRVNVVLTGRPIERTELSRLTPNVIVARASFDLVVSP
jgi:hypothetical protein